MTASNYYGINTEIIESYRRNIIFNNTLLVKNFEPRYQFQTDQRVFKMKVNTPYHKAASEDAIERFKRLRAAHMPGRKADYEEKLRNRVEPYVLSYAKGIAQFLSSEQI